MTPNKYRDALLEIAAELFATDLAKKHAPLEEHHTARSMTPYVNAAAALIAAVNKRARQAGEHLKETK